MTIHTPLDGFSIRSTTADDVPLILAFIRELAAYEKLEESVTATESLLREHLFGSDPVAEVIFGVQYDEVVAFALYFRNFSTFLGKPGIYLEDLYVKPSARGTGIGTLMLAYLGHHARQRSYGRVEWWVLNWNAPAIGFYRSLGAQAMDEWTVQRVSGTALDRLAERLSPPVAEA